MERSPTYKDLLDINIIISVLISPRFESMFNKILDKLNKYFGSLDDIDIDNSKYKTCVYTINELLKEQFPVKDTKQIIKGGAIIWPQGEADRCPICLINFSQEDDDLVVTPCDHEDVDNGAPHGEFYHIKCLMSALGVQPTCPICHEGSFRFADMVNWFDDRFKNPLIAKRYIREKIALAGDRREAEARDHADRNVIDIVARARRIRRQEHRQGAIAIVGTAAIGYMASPLLPPIVRLVGICMIVCATMAGAREIIDPAPLDLNAADLTRW